MSLWDETNEDAIDIAPDQAAIGPRVGFLEAFETAYNQQVRASAMYGIEKAFHELDALQVDELRKAGVEDIPRMSDDAFGLFGFGAFSGEYLDVARFYEDGGDPAIADRLNAYDAKIEEYQKKYPDLQLRTSRAMWDEVRTTAQEYERRYNTERNTWGGTLGGFVGGVTGSLNVESDPFNVATLPVGTVGKNIIQRVLGQSAGQGIIEAINQVTGVQEQRRLIGVDHGFADGLSRVGGAALGGAVLQGVGEGIAVGARRFFSDPPVKVEPPAPVRPTRTPLQEVGIPPDLDVAAQKLVRQPQTYMEYIQEVSPWSASRLGKARTVLDADNVRVQLDDWTGPDPAFLAPKADTAINLPRSDFTTEQPNIFDRVADKSVDHVDATARQIDPETFVRYDKLVEENNTYRRWLGELLPKREEDAALAELNKQIDELREKISTRGKMKGKKLQKQLDDLAAQRDAVKAKALSTDTPDMAKVRARIMRNDEKMREMAPVISRAYARARNSWESNPNERAAVLNMIREGRKAIGPVEQPNPLQALPKSLYEKAPILQQAYKVEGKLKADADSADVAKAILKKNAEDLEPVLDDFRKQVEKIVKDAEKAKESGIKPPESKEGELPPDEILIPGYKEPLHLDRDKLTVPTEDGTGTREISIR